MGTIRPTGARQVIPAAASRARSLAGRFRIRPAAEDLPTAPAGGAPGSEPATHDANAYIEGPCFVCGDHAVFKRHAGSPRETYHCPVCKASLRDQGQAKALVDLYAEEGAFCLGELVEEARFSDLEIYEPGTLGSFRPYFSRLAHYHRSAYWPEVPAGNRRDGIECQDIMGLTYDDGAFDLVITSEVFEHVRRPNEGFAEVARVLRPGGRHVFTIPVMYPLPENTVARVDTSGSQDVFLSEPRYHNSRHLVYTDFGVDLIDTLESEHGLATSVHRLAQDDADDRGRIVTFVSTKRGDPPAA